MIDINKKYRTKDGKEVRIYTTDGTRCRPVHGSIKNPDGWSLMGWVSCGSVYNHSRSRSDLVEVVMLPEYWVVWDNDERPYVLLWKPSSWKNRTIIHHPAQQKPVTQENTDV